MGAYGTNSNTGAAHIYELVGTSWYGRGALTASDEATYDLFGTSVAIDGDYAICGAPGHDLTAGGEGATYIFEKPITGWTTMTETQKITASDNAGGNGFGKSVSVDGEDIIVSSPDNDDGGTASGSAYIFNRGTSTWSEVTKLVASDAATQDYFGWGVSISGNSAISGAYVEDNGNGVNAGSAYIFDYTNQPPTNPIITGPTSGKAGTEYDYTFVSTDPNGDDLWYHIKCGDNTYEEWVGTYESGEEVVISHTWDEEGTFIVQAKAKDIFDAESEWGTLEVTMPLNQNILSNWLL